MTQWTMVKVPIMQRCLTMTWRTICFIWWIHCKSIGRLLLVLLYWLTFWEFPFLIFAGTDISSGSFNLLTPRIWYFCKKIWRICFYFQQLLLQSTEWLSIFRKFWENSLYFPHILPFLCFLHALCSLGRHVLIYWILLPWCIAKYIKDGNRKLNY